MTTEEINNQAMEMILHAGNARNLLEEALAAINKGNGVECDSKMKEARKEIVEAHRAQTVVLQKSMNEPIEYSVLFTHAQDTLMTINSEMETGKYLILLFKKIEACSNGK